MQAGPIQEWQHGSLVCCATQESLKKEEEKDEEVIVEKRRTGCGSRRVAGS